MDRIPILKMGQYLLVTIQVDLYDRLALDLEADLISQIAQTNVRGVLIDISAVSIVDSFMGRIFSNIANNQPFAAALAIVPIVVMIAYLLVARRLGAFEHV